MGIYTGLGSSQRAILDNNIHIEPNEFWNNFLDAAISSFNLIKEYGGFSFHIDSEGFTFGIEPRYQFDNLEIVYIDFNDFKNSSICKGIAFGVYGSNRVMKTKKFSDYKRTTRFTKFIEEWAEKTKEECLKIINKQGR